MVAPKPITPFKGRQLIAFLPLWTIWLWLHALTHMLTLYILNDPGVLDQINHNGETRETNFIYTGDNWRNISQTITSFPHITLGTPRMYVALKTIPEYQVLINGSVNRKIMCKLYYIERQLMN